MTALTTEHFVLQTAASTTVSEASARASLYLMTLSSALVALGFTADTDAFVPLVSTVLPLVVVLGVFTTVRLVDTGVENVAMLASIAHIRSYYRTLSPDAPSYFPARSDDEVDDALASMSTKREAVTSLFTMASMIAVTNSIVAAAGVAMLVIRYGSRPLGFATGTVVAVVTLATFYWYQNRRYQVLHAARAARAASGPTP
jgi:hypothetical protein